MPLPRPSDPVLRAASPSAQPEAARGARGPAERLAAIAGVHVRQLQPNFDERGAVTELFREEWELPCRPNQWNADRSLAGTLRGVHAHHRRYDYIVVLQGRLFLALHDARKTSPTFGLSLADEVTADSSVAIVLPPGVAHGLYFREDGVTLIGFSAAWHPSDDVRCHHAAPELKMAWPGPITHISRADCEAPPYDEFLRALAGEA